MLQLFAFGSISRLEPARDCLKATAQAEAIACLWRLLWLKIVLGQSNVDVEVCVGLVVAACVVIKWDGVEGGISEVQSLLRLSELHRHLS